jgi:three-Cys-motif partner protein
MAQHKFGGNWTELKLQAFEDYLFFYTRALQNQKFKRLYIDAFAGTGECTITVNNQQKTIPGSAKIALDHQSYFNKLIFIDDKRKHISELESLCANNSKTEIYHGNANKKVKELCNDIDWKENRAVMFLDPYGLDVEWETLKAITATKAIDICFLFSLSGLFRQAALDFNRVDEHKAKALDTCLGTTEWRDALYKKTGQQDMFDGEQAPIREAGVPEMEDYVKSRLETIFPAVTKPIRLPQTGAPLFSLFIAVSNPSPKAKGLAMRVATHIVNKMQQ